MNALQIILNILLIIASLVIISGSTETFFGKAKNAALEAKLALATKISAAVFVVLALIMIFVG